MKKQWIAIVVAIVTILTGIVAWLFYNLHEQKIANQEMAELAELDKEEMENEYERFTLQYGEMMTQINNDSLVAQLTQEQLRTQQLLEELKNVKATDAREITRLKKELSTVRAVLRSYIRQVDSLNQVNETLRNENSQIRDELAASNREIAGLATEKASLSEKVAIAAQLDATNIVMTPLNKRNKAAKKMKDCKQIHVSFTITKNVTATNGNRTVYVRIQTPNGDILSGGMFDYEDRKIEYSMKKTIEYGGEEVSVSTYWNVNEFLSPGEYRVSIFSDGHMIGSRTFSFN
jgi:flagellar basal body-associated protein FliL